MNSPGKRSLSNRRSSTLTVAAYTAFAPVTWNDAGAARGKDIEFLRAFARRHSLELEVKFFDFDRIWERQIGRAHV